MKEPYQKPAMLTEKVEAQTLVANGSGVSGPSVTQQAMPGLCCD